MAPLRFPAVRLRRPGLPHAAAMRRAERPFFVRRMVLVAPLFLFLLLNFLAPISLMLMRSVEDSELPSVWPQTAASLRKADPSVLPDKQLAGTLLTELAKSYADGRLSEVANRLNYDEAGFRTLLFRTAEHLGEIDRARLPASLLGFDRRWREPETWAVMRHAAGPSTSFYLLAAVDRRLDTDDKIVRSPSERAVFVQVLVRTFWISAVVALLCLVLGYPLAYLLATLPEKYSNALMILVLLPFWTSTLVRTTAWIVLLQTHGAVNDFLLGAGVIGQPLALIYNRVGVYVAMTHVLLPYFVLPLYAVMKGISPVPLRAALSLGATPMRTFWSVYAPQTGPGIAAGGLLVFVLALGYYITPALVGGPADQMISYFIAFYTNQSLNWGMAAALSLVLLIATLFVMWLNGRMTGDRLSGWRA